jgi:hypothetical protein
LLHIHAHQLSIDDTLRATAVHSFVLVSENVVVGHALSNDTGVFDHTELFPLFDISFTAPVFNKNNTDQLTLLIHVNVNTYVLLKDVHATVELFHNVNKVVSYCTLLTDTLVWLIPSLSVQVKDIVHAIHHEIHINDGVHQLHIGFHPSAHIATKTVFCVICTVVLVLHTSAGTSHSFTVQFWNT